MKGSFILFLILAALLGAGISSASLYFSKIIPLQTKINEMSAEADDAAIENAGFDIFVAVNLRESNQDNMLKELDESILPSDIRVFHKLMAERSQTEGAHCQYLLWRLKKYSTDFSVDFPKNEKEILNAVSNERPNFPGKIGKE